MTYELHEVPGLEFSETLRNLNSLVPEWPQIQDRHLVDGFWWVVFTTKRAKCNPQVRGKPVAFAGLVPMVPFPRVGYLKRCLVLPDHHGHGLQYRLMMARELKARQLGWTHLVSECLEGNSFSAGNFRKAGFVQCDPEQKWGDPNSIYWIKCVK